MIIKINYGLIFITTDINTAPVIQNIGLNQLAHVYFDETTPTDTLLFSPTVYDPDAGQTQTITYSVFPAAEVDMFDVSTSNIFIALFLKRKLCTFIKQYVHFSCMKNIPS